MGEVEDIVKKVNTSPARYQGNMTTLISSLTMFSLCSHKNLLLYFLISTAKN